MDPRKMPNDTLALTLELWAMTNDDLTASQLAYFDEIAWRLKLTTDKEQEKIDE